MKFGMNPSPYYRGKRSTTQIMAELMIGLAVIWVCAIIFYFTRGAENGVRAIVNPIIAMAVSVLVEALFMLPKHLKEKGNFASLITKLLNSYGYVTGMILALLLPVGTSIFAIVVSSIFAIAVGKMFFGGFGHNIFNPAILGRIFAQTAFMSQMAYDVDPTISTGATVTTMLGQNGWSVEMLQVEGYSLPQLLMGNYLGTLCETFTIALVVVGIILMLRRVIDWRAPVFYLGTMFVASLGMGLFGGYGLASFEFALIQISIGGVMFGAVFCITDPVSTPTSQAGRVFYGIGAAMITMIIRYIGSMPEGVAYSILLMNAVTPLIDSTIKGLTSQFKKQRIITATVMGAVALTAGCMIGTSDVNKAQFINYLEETKELKTGEFKTSIKRLSNFFGISKYNVSIEGILNPNTVEEIGKIDTIYKAEVAQYSQYFSDTANYQKAKYDVNYNSKAKTYTLVIAYQEVATSANKTIDVLDITPTVDSTTNCWKLGSYLTDISAETLTTIYDSNPLKIEKGILTLEFADEHKNYDLNYQAFVQMSFNVSMNVGSKVITKTEFVSCGGTDEYGAHLLTDGANTSHYFEYGLNKTALAEFYNKYIKVDAPVSFDTYMSVYNYDSFMNYDKTATNLIVKTGCTFTQIGFMTMMQKVITYAIYDNSGVITNVAEYQAGKENA